MRPRVLGELVQHVLPAARVGLVGANSNGQRVLQRGALQIPPGRAEGVGSSAAPPPQQCSSPALLDALGHHLVADRGLRRA
eukprot:7414862-Pyramimonas_sp.AAC.1